MTDLNQLIQVEDERVKNLLSTLTYEANRAGPKKLTVDSPEFTFITNAYFALKHHLTRRDTLRELLTK